MIKISLGIRSESLVLCRNVLEELWVIKLHFVAPLFKGNTKDLLSLDRSRYIVRVNLDNIVCPLTLRL